MKLITLLYMLAILNSIECMQSLKSIDLEPTLKHIYRIPVDSAHDKGFHCYNVSSLKIYENRFGHTLCKIKPNLWVYALSNIYDVHMGYVIKNGKVLKNKHSFFPVNFELKPFLENHIALIDASTIPWQQDADDECHKVKMQFKTKVSGKRKIPFTLNVVLKQTLDDEIICLTAFPSHFEVIEKQSRTALLAYLASLAEQQRHALDYEAAMKMDMDIEIKFYDRYGCYTFIDRDML